MPKIFEVKGYKVYIWQNENGEEIHVHIQKGAPQSGATKVWLLSNRNVALAHNKSRIKDKDLHDIMVLIKMNWDIIVSTWMTFHKYIRFKV